MLASFSFNLRSRLYVVLDLFTSQWKLIFFRVIMSHTVPNRIHREKTGFIIFALSTLSGLNKVLNVIIMPGRGQNINEYRVFFSIFSSYCIQHSMRHNYSEKNKFSLELMPFLIHRELEAELWICWTRQQMLPTYRFIDPGRISVIEKHVGKHACKFQF